MHKISVSMDPYSRYYKKKDDVNGKEKERGRLETQRTYIVSGCPYTQESR